MRTFILGSFFLLAGCGQTPAPPPEAAAPVTPAPAIAAEKSTPAVGQAYVPTSGGAPASVSYQPPPSRDEYRRRVPSSAPSSKADEAATSNLPAGAGEKIFDGDPAQLDPKMLSRSDVIIEEVMSAGKRTLRVYKKKR